MLLGILVYTWIAVAPAWAAAPDPRVSVVLKRWESMSQQRTREGLTVRTLQPYLGPLRLDSLLPRFTWSMRGDSELVAIPAVPSERQFSPNVTIAIDAQGLPQSVSIGQLRHAVRDLIRTEIAQVAARESVSTESEIVRVSFTADSEAHPLNSRVREVISHWVAASKSARAVRASFRRIDYDSAIEVETQSIGEFVYCDPHQGLYQSFSNPPREAHAGTRIGLNGQPYVRLAGEELMLVWNGKDLTQIDFTTQCYEVFERPGTPREVLGAGSFDAVWQTLITPQSALPMVAGLDEHELLTHYTWELVVDDKHAITLRGTPVTGPEASLYSSAQVAIDPVSFRTQATRLIDISGSKETLHQFRYQIVSQDAAALGDWLPDLTQYRRAGEVSGVLAAPVGGEDQSLPPPPPAE